MKKDEWKDKAGAAFGKYLAAIERDTGEESSIAEIEQAMLKHYGEMMSETMQALANAKASPPEAA